MIILTDAEYKRRIEDAKQQGWKEHSALQERDQFQETIWKAIRETRQDFDRQIQMLAKVMVKAGMEDPFVPKDSGPCVCANPGDIGY